MSTACAWALHEQRFYTRSYNCHMQNINPHSKATMAETMHIRDNTVKLLLHYTYTSSAVLLDSFGAWLSFLSRLSVFSCK